MGQEQGAAARPSTRPSRRQQKGRVDGPGERSRRACASPPAACLSPQRSRKLHRHGRHARGGGQGGGGRARHPHGGGQPATPAPRLAREALSRAMERETLGYTLALGITPLRERIARHYRERYGVDVDPERVVVTTGSSAAFVLAFLALFDAGARVALPSPGYPCYRHILTSLGCRPVEIETGPADALDAGAGPGRGARRRRRPRRAAHRQPRQSDRHDADAAAARRAGRALPRQRPLVHLRRDLSRSDLGPARRDRPAVRR